MLRTAKILWRQPGFSGPAVLMLAAGIVLSTVCYAVLEAAVFNVIPYESPARLVQVMKKSPEMGDAYWKVTRADFEVIRNRISCFESLGYEAVAQGTAAVGAESTPVTVARVSAGLFDALKVRPAIGRGFRPEDFRPGAPRVAVLSHAYWTRAFSREADAVGKSLTVDGNSYTVIGVAPPQVKRPVSNADVWIADETPAEDPSASTIGDKLVVGRLRQGCSLRDAERELAKLEPAPGRDSSRTRAQRFFALSLADQIVGPAARILNLLLAACLLIQLLACLNVGHLLLARRMNRVRDLGVQMALGCGAGRLCWNVLVEAMTLAAAAVGIALPLILLSLPAAGAVTTAAIGSETHPVLSIPVLAFSIGAGFASSVVCAVVPAVMLVRMEITALIQERWRFSELTLSASRLQDVLVVIEVAAAVVIMAGFGLLAKALYQLSSVSLGFHPEGLSYAVFSGGPAAFPLSAHSLERAAGRIARLPGVDSVAIGSTPILTGAAMKAQFDALTNSGEWTPMPPVLMQAVSRSYFPTMGIAVEGRSFDNRDVRGAPCAAVVNQSFAKLAWGSTDALGKRIDVGDPGRRVPCEVVGVAADTRDVSITLPPEPAVFFSHLQRRGSGLATILIRARQAPSEEQIRAEVAAADPSWRWGFSTNIGALVGTAIRPASTRARLNGSLAAVALLLAVGGVYAAVTFSLSRGAKDLGVRLALGAGPAQLIACIYSRYVRLVAAGVLAGAAAAVWLGGILSAGLSVVEVNRFDPLVFTAVPAFCFVMVLAAILPPARRALRIDPASLLRAE